MGAVIGVIAFLAAIFALEGLTYIAWAALTLSKYALYRACKLGKMPMREYFKYYYKLATEQKG